MTHGQKPPGKGKPTDEKTTKKTKVDELREQFEKNQVGNVTKGVESTVSGVGSADHVKKLFEYKENVEKTKSEQKDIINSMSPQEIEEQKRLIKEFERNKKK